MPSVWLVPSNPPAAELGAVQGQWPGLVTLLPCSSAQVLSKSLFREGGEEREGQMSEGGILAEASFMQQSQVPGRPVADAQGRQEFRGHRAWGNVATAIFACSCLNNVMTFVNRHIQKWIRSCLVWCSVAFCQHFCVCVAAPVGTMGINKQPLLTVTWADSAE